MSTIVDLLKAGLNVKAAGVVPAKSIYTPEKSDRTFYTLKIASFGRTIRVGFESEADLAAAPDIGTEIRLQAPMSREDRGYGAVIKGSQSVLSVAGREGWEGPLTETEIMDGATFAGFCKITQKESCVSKRDGKQHYTFTACTLGETFSFRELERTLFERVKEGALYYVTGSLEEVLSYTSDGPDARLQIVLTEALTLDEIKAKQQTPRRAEAKAS